MDQIKRDVEEINLMADAMTHVMCGDRGEVREDIAITAACTVLAKIYKASPSVQRHYRTPENYTKCLGVIIRDIIND